MTDLEDVVRQAWIATFAPAEIDPALSWEEAGADSLRSLRLLLELEKALGRKLSFDVIDPDMTIRELAERLTIDDATPPESGDVPATPIMFLVPGVFGDEPILADFRRWFGPGLRFEIIDLPEIDQPSAIHVSMAKTGGAIAREIERRRPRGELLIAGYSFGGGVAYEAARILLDNGREIALLCILDAEFYTPEKRAAGEAHRPGRHFVRRIIRALARSDVARGLIFAATMRLRPGSLIAMRRLLLIGLRAKALRQWRPKRLVAPILLVLNEDTDDETLTNWSRLLPGAGVVRTPGGHRDLFRPPAMARVGPAIWAAISQQE